MSCSYLNRYVQVLAEQMDFILMKYSELTWCHSTHYGKLNNPRKQVENRLTKQGHVGCVLVKPNKTKALWAEDKIPNDNLHEQMHEYSFLTSRKGWRDGSVSEFYCVRMKTWVWSPESMEKKSSVALYTCGILWLACLAYTMSSKQWDSKAKAAP